MLLVMLVLTSFIFKFESQLLSQLNALLGCVRCSEPKFEVNSQIFELSQYTIRLLIIIGAKLPCLIVETIHFSQGGQSLPVDMLTTYFNVRNHDAACDSLRIKTYAYERNWYLDSHTLYVGLIFS